MVEFSQLRVKYEIEILTSEYDWSSRFGFRDTVFYDFLNIIDLKKLLELKILNPLLGCSQSTLRISNFGLQRLLLKSCFFDLFIFSINLN